MLYPIATWKNGIDILLVNSETIEDYWDLYFKKKLVTNKKGIYNNQKYYKKISSAKMYDNLFREHYQNTRILCRICDYDNLMNIVYRFVCKLFNHDKIKFILKHLWIQKVCNNRKIIEKMDDVEKKINKNYEVFIVKFDEKLFSFLNQTNFFSDYNEEIENKIILQQYLENIFNETEINKELKEKEMNKIFEDCINLYNSLEIKKSYH